MQRKMVAREMKRCKNAWFQEKAREVKITLRKRRGAWKGLRPIQRGRAGLRPVRPNAIKDLDGKLFACPVRPNAIKDLDGKLCACQDSTFQH